MNGWRDDKRVGIGERKRSVMNYELRVKGKGLRAKGKRGVRGYGMKYELRMLGLGRQAQTFIFYREGDEVVGSRATDGI